MGRRSDHTRDELEALFIDAGRTQLAEVGRSRFSARDVAKRVGYSIGTLYNVFGSADGLMLAINACTLSLWTEYLREQLAQADEDRIAALVQAYFRFAEQNSKTWLAIYEHHLAGDEMAPDWYHQVAAGLVELVAAEVAATLPGRPTPDIASLTVSLIATVHGHCVFALYRTFVFLGQDDPVEAALARVREILRAAGSDARR